MMASVKHRGLGSVFRLKYRDKKTGKRKDSKCWHIQYFVNGKPIRERTGSHNRMDAVAVEHFKGVGAAQGVAGEVCEYRIIHTAADHRTIWFPTHHPRNYGKFGRRRMRAGPATLRRRSVL
jgi:hypothetical protein